MALCPPPAAEGIVTGLVYSVDCQIHTMVHESYRELVGPGTTFAAVFTAMLTIYIALIGYQLLLGRGGVRLTALPTIALKIGLIMAFVTSWSAYQTVIFSFLFDGPRELLAILLRPVTGANSDIYGGIEHAYATLSAAASVYGGQANAAGNILQGGPMLGAGVLWLSAIGILIIIIGVILAAKIVLGFLLALGPVFVALFLFDATRGLFDGWLRAALMFAIAPLAANVFGAAMLLMLSPFLMILSKNASLGVFDMGPIITIGLVVIVFAIVMGMALKAAATITGGFTTSRTWASTASGGATEAPSNPQSANTLPALEAHTLQIAPPAFSATARRTDIVREPAATSFERLGQAYRRAPRPALRTRTA